MPTSRPSDVSAAAQHEITKPSPLLDDSGALVQTGWARRPLLDCNMENARTVGFRPLQRFRAKRWDYYGVTSPSSYFSITLADLGYAGLALVYFVDFAKASVHEETLTFPFGRGTHLLLPILSVTDPVDAHARDQDPPGSIQTLDSRLRSHDVSYQSRFLEQQRRSG